MLDFGNCELRIETQRFGPFTFQVGVNPGEVETALLRVIDAHERFVESPLSQVANRLEREVIASSVFGTNSIEGGTLTEEETAEVLEIEPARVKEIEQRRVVNIKAAYDLARQASETPDWQLNLDFICRVHAVITRDLPHQYNQPGQFRDNPKGIVTQVGSAAHGGKYKPPQYGGDIRLLMAKLIEWHECLVGAGVPPLIRAPLIHLYFEWIHPFWGGNGRVGRVIEATLLRAGGFRYAPFALARYYLEEIDQYFTLFNICRKAAEKHRPSPNLPFVAFHLEGMRVVINRLHQRVNRMVAVLLYEAQVKRLYDQKELNVRQYAILTQLIALGPIRADELRRAPWYEALYLKRNDKTRQRDMRKLREMGLIVVDSKNTIWPSFLRPANGEK
jgi:Fic family protein